MAVLIIYANQNRGVTEKVLTPENTQRKGNVNISNDGPGAVKKPRGKIFRKFLR